MAAVVRGLGSALRSLARAVDEVGSSLSYRETLSRAQTIAPFGGKVPSLGEDVFVAPNASVIGDVTLGAGSSVWYGAVIRGDVNSVSIGSQTNVQDNVVIHVARHNAANRAAPTTIGSNVTIGHGATIHAADIEDCALIGMGATVMDGARVQKGAIVAAGALVTPGATVPSGEIWAGSPAKLLRKLVEGEAAFISAAAEDYSRLAAVHAVENSKTADEVEADIARRADRVERDPEHDVQQGVDRDPITREITNVAQSM